MEVKFATRFDSPACLDIFDQQVSLQQNDNSSSMLHISAMCRNDKKLLKYYLDLDLYDQVHDFTIDPQLQLDFDEQHQEFTNEMESYKQKHSEWQR